MKNMYFFSGMIVLGFVTTVDAKDIKNKQLSVEEVQYRKIARQKELARQPVYKMLDAAIVDNNGLPTIDWAVVFKLLNSMKGVINVNEYHTANDDSTLLDLACDEHNLSAAKILLQQYRANPNIGEMTSLMIACDLEDVPTVTLLLQYGGNPIHKSPADGSTALDFAADKPEILKLLKRNLEMKNSAAAAA